MTSSRENIALKPNKIRQKLGVNKCIDQCGARENVYELIVRLSTAKTANAERRLAVCRLPFRPRCSSV